MRVGMERQEQRKESLEHVRKSETSSGWLECSCRTQKQSGLEREMGRHHGLKEFDCFLMGSGKTVESGDSRNGLTLKVLKKINLCGAV